MRSKKLLLSERRQRLSAFQANESDLRLRAPPHLIVGAPHTSLRPEKLHCPQASAT